MTPRTATGVAQSHMHKPWPLPTSPDATMITPHSHEAAQSHGQALASRMFSGAMGMLPRHVSLGMALIQPHTTCGALILGMWVHRLSFLAASVPCQVLCLSSISYALKLACAVAGGGMCTSVVGVVDPEGWRLEVGE